MYWIYNVLLIFYWIGLIPVILYRLAFEDGFYESIGKRSQKGVS